MAYSVPLGVLVGSLVLMVLVLLLVLRSRKKRRTRRLTARMQSPTLKEVSLLTKEGELGLLFPNSPLSPHHGNTSPSDPLEFPRSRLYIYNNKVLGELHTVYQGDTVFIAGRFPPPQWPGNRLGSQQKLAPVNGHNVFTAPQWLTSGSPE